MKNKMKVTIVLLLLFLTTGCSVNYDLTIGDNSFKESFDVIAYENDEYSKSDLYYEYLAEYPIYIDEEFIYDSPQEKNESFTYYKKSYKELNNGYIFSYKADYNNENIKKSTFLNTVFNSISKGYIADEKIHYFSLGEPIIFNNYPELNNVNINIRFEDNIEIVSSNADSVVNNVYKWSFTNGNSKKLNIRYKLKDTELNETIDNDDSDNEVNWINEHLDVVMISTVIVLFITLVVIIIYKVSSSKK